MKPNSLPKDVFGTCPVCGRTGLDDEGNRLTGYKLIEFRGQWMCIFSKIDIEDRENDDASNEKHIEQNEFFHGVGMKFNVQ